MKIVLLLCLAFTLISCGSETSKDNTEQLKQDNQILKEELNAKVKAELTAKAQEDHYENIIGNWFVPHAAMVNIKFTRDKRFVFNDFNSDLMKEEILSGHYELNGKTLTLFYDDRPKQRFAFKKGAKGDDNYYITKTGYYFVKGMNGDE
jgi:hypothetical protein